MIFFFVIFFFKAGFLAITFFLDTGFLDLRTTFLKKQSKLAASSNVLTLGDSNEQKLYDSDDGTGDEDEEISQKVKLPKIYQYAGLIF